MLLDRSHREYFRLFVRRDLKVRYAGSTLGGLWNLIHPLAMIAIYMTIFSSIMRNRMELGGAGAVDYGSLAYGVHLCAGLIPWLLFSDVLIRSTGVLIENNNLLKKVSFPPIVLFLTVLFNGLLVHGAGFLCFLAILWAMGQPVPATAVGGLGILLLLGLCGMGLGLILAGLNVLFRDTAQILSVVMQILFWFNPIVYPKAMLFKADQTGEGLTTLVRIGRVLVTLNPFERFISAGQRLMGLPLGPTGWVDWSILLLFPAACLVGGVLFFRAMLPEIRDCL